MFRGRDGPQRQYVVDAFLLMCQPIGRKVDSSDVSLIRSFALGILSYRVPTCHPELRASPCFSDVIVWCERKSAHRHPFALSYVGTGQDR